jgi:hypothetical protein
LERERRRLFGVEYTSAESSLFSAQHSYNVNTDANEQGPENNPALKMSPAVPVALGPL